MTPSPIKPIFSATSLISSDIAANRQPRAPSPEPRTASGRREALSRERYNPNARLDMKRAFVFAALTLVAAPPLLAGGKGSVTGAYVEARTAEVFTGGCIMNSEAETMGKQALLAWKVDRGSFNGVAIDGLAIVAAVAGDRNLGMQEMGGEKPSVRSALFVDQRANAAQQLALVAMANELSKGLVGTIVQVTPAPIAFTDHGSEIQVTAGPASLDVNKHITPDPTC